ncbi:twin-arginine translocation pathway signal protein [Roseomonas sp. OT10]|uniref:Bug family tripartite tricarboxylate transporter substrate binding protein n=1 Tax=Roseomonas cutis TaxID=2897332 RepID=UPI001E43AD00|nr:tripartite tricarboxylate transporter substrate-binding protein [Roseomonas sp. OT10]UFN49647.1 twin-arginine translocation pathway signal protein [Roseomonas sp. OT10]
MTREKQDMSTIGRRGLPALSAALCVPALWPGRARAEEWPARPVRIVIPYGAGGAADTMARLLFARASELLRQPVVIENRTGGNAVPAAGAVLQSPRDGYTFLIGAAHHVTNPLLLTDIPFDFRTAFAPVTQLCLFNQVLAVRKDYPAEGIEEFVRTLRARPGAVTYGTPPAAAIGHLTGELFQRRAGVRMIHSPYRLATDAARDVASGAIDAVILTPSTIAQAAQAGRARLLAVTGGRRTPACPEVPTLAETVLPGFDMVDWFGLFAASGTAEPILRRIQAAVAQAAQDPTVRARLEPTGGELVASTPDAFGGFLKQQEDILTGLIREAEIRLG